jgi:hypothetical protein
MAGGFFGQQRERHVHLAHLAQGARHAPHVPPHAAAVAGRDHARHA